MERIEKNNVPEEKPESLTGKVLKMLLKIGIAGGILAYLIYSTGGKADGYLARLEHIRWGFLIPAALLYGFHIFANAWRWHLLLKVQNIPCSLWEANSLTMQSFFFSLVMPGGAIGGDVVRAGFFARALPKERVFDGIFTILMDRFTGMLGIFSLAILMLPFTWWCVGGIGGTQSSSGLSYTTLFIWLLLAGSVAGILAAVVVFQHRKFERFKLYLWLRKTADRFSGGMFTRIEESLDMYREHGKTLVVCVLASIVMVNLVLAGVMYFVCLAFVPASQVSVSAALGAITIGNIAGLIPATPSGIGARDFCVMSILAAASFPADPLLPALVMSGLIIGFNLLGGLFFLFSKHPKFPAESQH